MSAQAVKDVRQAMPGTVRQLVDRSGWCREAVERCVKVLRAASDSHVGGWQAAAGAGGQPAKIHHAGPGRDQPCRIKPLTPAEIWARRVKAGGREEHNARVRAHYQRKRGVHLRDPLQQAAFNLVKVTNEQPQPTP